MVWTSEKLVTSKAMLFTLTPTCYVEEREEIRMSSEAFVVVASFGVNWWRLWESRSRKHSLGLLRAEKARLKLDGFRWSWGEKLHHSSIAGYNSNRLAQPWRVVVVVVYRCRSLRVFIFVSETETETETGHNLVTLLCNKVTKLYNKKIDIFSPMEKIDQVYCSTTHSYYSTYWLKGCFQWGNFATCKRGVTIINVCNLVVFSLFIVSFSPPSKLTSLSLSERKEEVDWMNLYWVTFFHLLSRSMMKHCCLLLLRNENELLLKTTTTTTHTHTKAMT